MKSLLLALVLICCCSQGTNAQYRQNDELHAATGLAFDAPRASANRSTTTSQGQLPVVIEWGAPLVKGRLLTGGLISTYKVWRTGANEATTIHFEEDVLVEGEPLPAGTYSLFTIGGKKKWTIIFNSVHQQWGAFTYDRKKDVLRVKVDPGTADEHQEELEFAFEDPTPTQATIVLRWGDLAIRFTVASASSS